MVYRVFVEKKEGLDNEAKGLLNEARTLLGMERLENVRLFNRYDAENITEDLFRYAVKTVFSEPQLDTASASIQLPGAYVFAVEALPDHLPGRASPHPHRQGLRPVWCADGRGHPGIQKIRHQPGGMPGGVSGRAGDPRYPL